MYVVENEPLIRSFNVFDRRRKFLTTSGLFGVNDSL
jgi:hypothetical protein